MFTLKDVRKTRRRLSIKQSRNINRTVIRILIIATPSVGINKEKRAVIDNIVSAIKDRDGTVDITYSMKPGMGKKYSSMAAFEGYNAIYAAGGDGIVNDVASGLVGRDIPLGIIPLGTGNGFARGLNIPLNEEGFTEILLKNKTMKVDTGKISSHYFFATCGIGYDSHIAHDFNKPHKLNRKVLTYFYFALKNYIFTRQENVTLIFDGREIKRRIFGLTIANTKQYGGGAIIAPQADPASGVLIAALFPKLNVFRSIPAIKKLFDGTVNEIKELEFIKFKTLKIKREKPDIFHVDGEDYKGDATLNITVLPASLNVIVP